MDGFKFDNRVMGGIIASLLTAIGIVVWTRLDHLEQKVAEVAAAVNRLEGAAGTKQAFIGPMPSNGG